MQSKFRGHKRQHNFRGNTLRSAAPHSAMFSPFVGAVDSISRCPLIWSASTRSADHLGNAVKMNSSKTCSRHRKRNVLVIY